MGRRIADDLAPRFNRYHSIEIYEIMAEIPTRLPKTINTPRLKLCAIQPEYSKLYHEAILESFELLNQWYGESWAKDKPSEKELETWVDERTDRWRKRTALEFAAFDNQSDQFIGAGCFHHLEWSVPKGRIGYWVRNSRSGGGLATEIANGLTQYGFEVLSLKRLEIRCAAGNVASSIIPKKLDYEYLTTFENNLVGNNGELWDIEIYARLSSDGLPSCRVTWE